jgi:hypothetical protein
MAFPPGAPFFPLSERMGEERTRGENPFDGVFPSNPFPRRPKWAVCPLWKPPHGELSAVFFSPLLPRRVVCARQRSPGFLDSAGKAFAVFPSAAPASYLSGAEAHAAVFVRGSCPLCFLDRAPMRGYPEGADGPLWSVRGDPQGGHSRKCPPCARLCILSARTESMPPEGTSEGNRKEPLGADPGDGRGEMQKKPPRRPEKGLRGGTRFLITGCRRS